jgi:peptidoglycan/LPS O-acetylase OafA/YrhL
MKNVLDVRSTGNFVASLPAILRRKTSGVSFVPQIDGLRFIAIFTVFTVHVVAYVLGMKPNSSSWLATNYEHLARGVQLFFVISGFVIAMPFIKAARHGMSAPPLKDYFLRRLTRLEPPFLIAMALTYAALVLVHHASARALLPHLLATCTYTHAMIYGSKSPIAFITWSLEIEIQFYLIAPLIMSAQRLQSFTRRVVLVVLALASLALRGLIASSHPVLAASVIEYLPFFVAGIMICDFAIASDWWRNRQSFVWDL